MAAGEIERVEVDGWSAPAYLRAGRTVPRLDRGTALLCPFDPLIFFRPRVERLFGFDYRIEIYTPAAKRQYGYYVWPLLLDGRLVARVDLKADRAANALRVVGAFGEPGHAASAGRRGAGRRTGVDGVLAGPGWGHRVRPRRSGRGVTRGCQAGQLMAKPSTMKELKDTLWKAANKLRGSLSASQYKDVILGLVFLKYISDARDGSGRLRSAAEWHAGSSWRTTQKPTSVGSSTRRWTP